MNKAYIIHGWDFNPQMHWYPWLINQLESKGFEVIAPEMPTTSHPKINEWIEKLRKIAPAPDKETYFIGHSIGCQTILRYLESLNNKIKVGGVVLVAPWFHLQNLENEESEKIVNPWLETPMDFDKINSHIPQNKLVAIFSDNDPFVPVADKEIFKALLKSKIIVEHNKGHFTEEDKITEVPKVLEELLNMLS